MCDVRPRTGETRYRRVRGPARGGWQNRRVLRVGLTGGIGSGKSTVAARLAAHGAVIIDADKLAREVVAPGTEGLAAVVAQFGTGVRTESGELDRAALAAKVFDDDDARARLNAIVHPLVRERSARLAADAPPDAVVVQDVPLLVEGGMSAAFQLVIVVHADEQVRVDRLVEQRGMSERDVRARIAAQATEQQRRVAADVWLDNDGSTEALEAAVDELWEERLVPFERNVRCARPAPRAAEAVLAPADPTWPTQARLLRGRIGAVLGERAKRIDHIGSTAVAGLDAKDTIDLQVVVPDLAAASALGDELIAAGLVHRSGRWIDNAFDGTVRDKHMATNADPARPVNCHIRPVDSPTWREALLLRDWLRAHPDGVREYAETKHTLAGRRLGSIDAYADAKTPFIRSAIERAETWAGQGGWVAAEASSE